MNLSMNNQPMKTNSIINLPGSGISRLVSVRRNTTVSLCCWLSACLLLLLTPCRADFATPFVEINKNVGEVSECYGYIAVLGPEMNTQFLVIVGTDAGDHVVLRATAKNGVVKEAFLGRQVKLKALVTKAGIASSKPALEIHHCEPMKIAQWKQKASGLPVGTPRVRVEQVLPPTGTVLDFRSVPGAGPIAYWVDDNTLVKCRYDDALTLAVPIVIEEKIRPEQSQPQPTNQ